MEVFTPYPTVTAMKLLQKQGNLSSDLSILQLHDLLQIDIGALRPDRRLAGED